MQLLEPAKKADGAVINPLASWRTSFTASDSHNDREANVAGDDAGFIAHCRKRSVEPAHRVLDILSSLSGVSSDEGVEREDQIEDQIAGCWLGVICSCLEAQRMHADEQTLLGPA